MQETKTYGGNITKKVSLDSSRAELADDAYTYNIYKINAGDKAEFNKNKSQIIYFYSTEDKLSATVEVSGEAQELNEQGSLLLENNTCTVTAKTENIYLFVSGTKDSYTEDKISNFVNDENIKRVSKPWGYEMWLNGEHPLYALKRIFIKAGNKTSLQYHEMKRETNFLFEGKAKLHFHGGENVDLNNVNMNDIENVELTNLTSIDVWPNNIHRIEADTDILLFETSTPHLDDVIRLSDDANRVDGRIADEHK